MASPDSVLWSKGLLSGAGSGGAPIVVTGTDAGSANTIHTAVAGTEANVLDEVWLDATNIGADDVELTLVVGAVAKGPITIPGKTTYRVHPGLPHNNGLVIKAHASTASVVVLDGWANQARAAA